MRRPVRPEPQTREDLITSGVVDELVAAELNCPVLHRQSRLKRDARAGIEAGDDRAPPRIVPPVGGIPPEQNLRPTGGDNSGQLFQVLEPGGGWIAEPQPDGGLDRSGRGRIARSFDNGVPNGDVVIEARQTLGRQPRLPDLEETGRESQQQPGRAIFSAAQPSRNGRGFPPAASKRQRTAPRRARPPCGPTSHPQSADGAGNR